VSTIFTETNSDAISNTVPPPAEESAEAEAYPIVPVLVIVTGLIATLAWIGFLAWGAGKVLDVW
jgi:hypothetical protein